MNSMKTAMLLGMTARWRAQSHSYRSASIGSRRDAFTAG